LLTVPCICVSWL